MPEQRDMHMIPTIAMIRNILDTYIRHIMIINPLLIDPTDFPRDEHRQNHQCKRAGWFPEARRARRASRVCLMWSTQGLIWIARHAFRVATWEHTRNPTTVSVRRYIHRRPHLSFLCFPRSTTARHNIPFASSTLYKE